MSKYAVVNDENVDSPSLVISEIPICHADYYCYFKKNHVCVITCIFELVFFMIN